MNGRDNGEDKQQEKVEAEVQRGIDTSFGNKMNAQKDFLIDRENKLREAVKIAREKYGNQVNAVMPLGDNNYTEKLDRWEHKLFLKNGTPFDTEMYINIYGKTGRVEIIEKD